MHTVAQTLDTGAGAWFRYGEVLNSELCSFSWLPHV